MVTQEYTLKKRELVGVDKHGVPKCQFVKPAEITAAPDTVKFGVHDLEMTGTLTIKNGGQYNTLCGVAQEHIVKVSHNIDRGLATIGIERLVRAVQIGGSRWQCTQGNYMSYGVLQQIPEGNEAISWTQAKIKSAAWQSDGPKSPADVTPVGNSAFEIRDTPGVAATMNDSFPYALRAEFILRITLTFDTKGEEPRIGEFHYDTYFECLSDPYPEGYRKAQFIKKNNRDDPYFTFDQIGAKFARDQNAAGQKPQFPKFSHGTRKGSAPKSGGRTRAGSG